MSDESVNLVIIEEYGEEPFEPPCLGTCHLCNENIPGRGGGTCFEDTERGHRICNDCVKAICRAYVSACLDITWQRG